MSPHKDSAFDLIPALFGSLVTVTHGYLNAKWFAQFGKHLAGSASDRWRWLRSPCFVLGLLLYVSGFTMVVYHDSLLRTMRTPGGPQCARHWPHLPVAHACISHERRICVYLAGMSYRVVVASSTSHARSTSPSCGLSRALRFSAAGPTALSSSWSRWCVSLLALSAAFHALSPTDTLV